MDLPLASAPAPRSTPRTRPESTTNRFDLRVLVAEDNEINQMVIRTMLQRLGVTVVIAGDGQAALDELESAPYDVVFMDVRMPVMNGYEATERIRARDDALARIPIFAVTADASAADARASAEAGMDGHLRKPLRTPEVVAALESVATAAVT